jgi:zinc transport system permease protein
MSEFLQYGFLVRALLAGAVLSVVAPTVGMFLVVRRYSLLADALAHVSLLGVALGFLLKVNPILSALAVSGLSAMGMERLRGDRRIFGESVLAVFLSGSLALAVVLIGLAKGFNINLLSFLFGSLVTVTVRDVWMISVLGAATVLFVAFFYRQLFVAALDDDLARTDGISVAGINTLLVVLAAFTVTLAMQMVGVLLVGALMVVPVLAAMQFDMGFLRTLLLAVLFSFLSVVAGLFFSYNLDIASGGAIVLVALSVFVAGLFLGRRR